MHPLGQHLWGLCEWLHQEYEPYLYTKFLKCRSYAFNHPLSFSNYQQQLSIESLTAGSRISFIK